MDNFSVQKVDRMELVNYLDGMNTATTYTLDAEKDGQQYFTDSGLTAQQVENARINFPRMGITILNVFDDNKPFGVADLAPFGIR